ncbi:MAG TPA: D-alanyl-D-alanine carboxypeptidase family protein [Paenibacillaceae bacterium]
MLPLSKRLVAAILSAFLAVSAMIAGASPAAAQEAVAPPKIDAAAAILIDAETGQVLFEQNADTPLPPASMAKMMTEYLVLKAVRSGQLSWDQVVTVGENAASQIGSRIFLARGDKHTIRELYIATAVGSANDASVQLAEAVAGSEEAFVELMNETARQLGMTNTHFINATGLDRADMPEKFRPPESAGETEMSARDAALLAYTILKEVPEFLEFSSILEYQFRERDKDPILNWNWMLESASVKPALRQFSYQGVDGMKTGHTSRALNCFTGTAKRGDRRLIAVVMGVPGRWDEGRRFLETAKLFDYGFNAFETATIVDAKTAVEGYEEVPVKKGKHRSVPVVTGSDIVRLMPKGGKAEVTAAEVRFNEPVVAPVSQGDKLGTVTFSFKDPVTGQIDSETLDLIAARDVPKAPWWQLTLRSIGDFFVSLFKGIVNLF